MKPKKVRAMSGASYMNPIGSFKDKSINSNCKPCNEAKTARPNFSTSQTIRVKKNVYEAPKENASQRFAKFMASLKQAERDALKKKKEDENPTL